MPLLLSGETSSLGFTDSGFISFRYRIAVVGIAVLALNLRLIDPPPRLGTVKPLPLKRKAARVFALLFFGPEHPRNNKHRARIASGSSSAIKPGGRFDVLSALLGKYVWEIHEECNGDRLIPEHGPFQTKTCSREMID
jgi:hypothetical protein